MITFRRYLETDYESVCRFLIELNRTDRTHINWTWARFEWMYGHPYTNYSLLSSIGLWFEKERIVGAALFDMYFGEAFCGVLAGYESLYPAVLTYAYEHMKDESGLAVAIEDGNASEIRIASKYCFVQIDQAETIQHIILDRQFSVVIPDGYSIDSVDPMDSPERMQWLFWQGFDHGDDYEAFLKEPQVPPRPRPHFNRDLSLCAYSPEGVPVAYTCLWKHPDVDYAYVEPVCTIPSARGKGLAKALLCEAMNRVRTLGAKTVYVISDQDFYTSIGFSTAYHYTFYRKP